MSVGERILLYLSRRPSEEEYPKYDAGNAEGAALDLLTRVYPNFSALVSGKRVVDFGCGIGNQSIALVKEHGCWVVEVDSNKATLRRAMENAKEHNVSPSQLSFVGGVSPEMRESFDVVISQNSFEHFPEPEMVLNEMSCLLSSSGVILITFGPPWLAPYGSHMHFFCKVPWINILFPEKAVMKARSHFRSDGATTYEDVESGLNRMTIAKFEFIVSSCNLKLIYKKYECVKEINCLSKVPLVRELFINHVTALLARAT